MNKKNIAPQWGEDRVVEFVKQLRRHGVTGEHAQVAIAEKGSATTLHAVVAALMHTSDTEPAIAYSVTVDYDLSLAAMIRKAGFNGYVNPDIITKHFSIMGEGEVGAVIELVHCNRGMTNAEVTTELDQRGLRDATLPELLALSEKFPNLQRQFPIVARGSAWRGPSGNRSVPFLWGSCGKRSLYLGYLDYKWDALHRFAGVRK